MSEQTPQEVMLARMLAAEAAKAQAKEEKLQVLIQEAAEKKKAELSEARKEVEQVMGDKPSLDDTIKFVDIMKKLEEEVRHQAELDEMKTQMSAGLAQMTDFDNCCSLFPYDPWAQKGCCICPPTAMCPQIFDCPIQCPCCFPLTLCGICKKPPFPCPRNNPLCAFTVLCKPICKYLADPICVVHIVPCECCCCCTCPKCPACCKTVGIEFAPRCCHMTFVKICPVCCPNLCCAEEVITPNKHIDKLENIKNPLAGESLDAPAATEMERKGSKV